MDFNVPEYTYRVKEVVKIIDGDTVDILIDLGFYITIYKRIRLLDIDTDEMRGGTDETKTRAVAAKERIDELLAMGPVFIRTKMDTTGKYGRVLGEFFVINVDTVIDVIATLKIEGYEKGNTETTFIKKLVSYLIG